MKLRIVVSTLLVILFSAGIATDASAAWRGWRGHGYRGGWCRGYRWEHGGYGCRHTAGEHNLPSTDFRTAHYRHGEYKGDFTPWRNNHYR